jgi:hypothetical protein
MGNVQFVGMPGWCAVKDRSVLVVTGFADKHRARKSLGKPMRIRDDRQWGQLNESVVADFERRHAITLPSDYRSFLLSHHGGVPEPSFYWVVLGDWGSGIESLYGFGVDGFTLDEYHVHRAEIGVSDELLVIGDDGCCNFICLGIVGPRRGRVFYVDSEYPNEAPEKIRLLANSFADFIGALGEAPDY